MDYAGWSRHFLLERQMLDTKKIQIFNSRKSRGTFLTLMQY